MSDDPLLSRDELVTLVARVHLGAAPGESGRAGRSLAAQSKLPKIIAENLGAGFGQWDFFPEPADIVDFAIAYVAPTTEEELMALARTWATEDSERRHTLMALVGREILLHELKRIEMPALREAVYEVSMAKARPLREALGLAVPAPNAPKRAKAPKAAPAARAPAAPLRPIPTRMPQPERKAPPAAAAKAITKRFHHPKFGEGVLEASDGEGPEAKLTIRFAAGPKTLQAKFVTEV